MSKFWHYAGIEPGSNPAFPGAIKLDISSLALYYKPAFTSSQQELETKIVVVHNKALCMELPNENSKICSTCTYIIVLITDISRLAAPKMKKFHYKQKL